MKISRRDFIKWCGASAALVGVGANLPPAQPQPRSKAVPVPKGGMAILVDVTKCIGCKSCEGACKEANHLPLDTPTALSATALTFVEYCNVSTVRDKPDIRNIKRQCMHCQDPACVSVCPVGALFKKENGVVAYDENVCLGCRYCMVACPFGVPKYNWNSPNPKINKCARKCLEDGKRTQPACVESCPAQAILYGQRDELLTMAKRRIRDNPTQYVDHIYGENELGGTGTLYLSNVPFEQLGFRTDLPSEPLPNLTWSVQEKIPAVIVGVISILSGVAWWTHRGEEKEK